MSNSPVLAVVVTCLGLFTWTSAAAAADVAVFAPEASNLSTQDASAVGELVAQSYALVARQGVLSPTHTQPALAQAKTYEAAAAQLTVREYIRLSAVATGRRVVISAWRCQADGRVLQQARQIAESVEDLAFSSDGVARTLFSGSPPAPPPGPPGQPAVAAPRPPETDDMVYGLKAGVHMPLARDATYYPAVSLQFNGRLQLPRVFFEFGAGFLLPTVIQDSPDVSCVWDNATMMSICPTSTSNRGHVGGFTAELGASYYLTQGDVGLYVGGGMITRVILAGLGSGDGYGDDERNIASLPLYAQFGLTFPRDNTTRFFADFRVAQAILPQYLENEDVVWPIEPTLHTGFGW
jgi:hypothetical protein